MSGRIRTVKPEWLDDERIAMASPEARVLSIALVLLADDYGNGRAGRVMLAGRVFPGKPPETLAKALDELAAWFVHLYEADGQSYFHIRNWEKHQKVDKPGKPRVPGPSGVPENIPETPENIRASRGSYVPGPGPDQDPDPDERVPCPRDLALTPDQRGTLESGGVPAWAIDGVTFTFVSKWAGGGDPRTVDAWRRSLVTTIRSAMTDPSKIQRVPYKPANDADTRRARAASVEARARGERGLA